MTALAFVAALLVAMWHSYYSKMFSYACPQCGAKDESKHAPDCTWR